MAKNNKIGKTKRSTDDMINDAINQQNAWLENRRNFTRRFWRRLNVFTVATPDDKPTTSERTQPRRNERNHAILRAYWFPILCALVVIFVALWMLFWRDATYHRIAVAPTVPEPIVRTVAPTPSTPEFDIVRIAPNGTIVVAGRGRAEQNISVRINGKIVATVFSDKNGEFVYAPARALKPGNYTISLVGADGKTKSNDRVFVYISEQGGENSMSLLMTSDGSRILQAPATLSDGDLHVSKIDYLDTGRIVVTGTALPRMRVSLALNDKRIGTARVSDHHNFGIGANVGELQTGENYVLTIRMHDGAGRTISQIGHSFVMPRATGNDDTFYTVRRGDCLWIIARNFTGNGARFTIIAAENNIANPNKIYPNQKLRIPTKGGRNERTAQQQAKVYNK